MVLTGDPALHFPQDAAPSLAEHQVVASVWAMIQDLLSQGEDTAQATLRWVLLGRSGVVQRRPHSSLLLELLRCQSSYALSSSLRMADATPDKLQPLCPSQVPRCHAAGPAVSRHTRAP